MEDDAQQPVISREVAQDEETPLLATTGLENEQKGPTRKIGIVVLLVLVSGLLIGILALVVLPRIAQSYVEETVQLELSSVRILDITHRGADVQLAGNIHLNSKHSQVGNSKRRLVDIMLSLLGPVRLSETEVLISLDNGQSKEIALAQLSPLMLRLAYANINTFNITSTLQILDAEVLGDLASKILRNDVNAVPLSAAIDTRITRFFTFHKTVSQHIVYDIPKGLNDVPPFNITQMAIQDSADSGISATAVLVVGLQLPISAKIPGIQVQLSVEGCDGTLIPLVLAESLPFEVMSDSSTMTIKAAGECRELPKNALRKCSGSDQMSPIDRAMQTYLAGNETTVYVGGYNHGGSKSWLQNLLAQVSIPIEVPGSQADQLARDIELSGVKFNLPSIIGGSGKPKISGRIRGIIDIPSDITVNVEVESVHVLADLIYKKKKFATIESPGWAPASSKFPSEQELLVEVLLKDAPVTITNQDVFSSVISTLFGGSVFVDVIGTGDVKISTSLGGLEAHRLPIEANDIEIGGFGFLGNLEPKILELGVSKTGRDFMEIVAIAEVE